MHRYDYDLIRGNSGWSHSCASNLQGFTCGTIPCEEYLWTRWPQPRYYQRLLRTNAAQKKEIVVNQSTYRKRLIETLRRFLALSRTTPELDNLDWWLAGRPLYFLLIMLAAPIVFFIRALRPLLLLRFGVFGADRMGVFAPTAHGYLLKNQRNCAATNS